MFGAWVAGASLVWLAACSDRALEPPSATASPRPGPPVFVLGHDELGAVSIVSSSTGDIAATIHVADRIGAIAVSADARQVFAAAPGGIAVVDVERRTVSRTIPFSGEPSGLVPAGDRLYVVDNLTSQGRVSAIELASGRIAGQRIIDHLAGQGVLSTDGRRLFIPHYFYSGRVTVLDAASLGVRSSMEFEDGASRIRLSPDGRYLHVPNGTTFSGRVSVVDTRELRKAADIDLGGEPSDLVISPDGRRAYAAMLRESSLVAIDLARQAVERTIPVAEYPIRLAISPDGTTIFGTAQRVARSVGGRCRHGRRDDTRSARAGR